VVIPCYNDGRTIRDAVGSLETQEPTEVIVVDDGSDDPETADILAQLAAEGIKVLRQENAGPASARMRGVNATSAPFVFPLDADDLLLPGNLTVLADALEHDESVVAAWGDIETFGETNISYRVARTLDPWLITYMNDVPMKALLRRSALTAVGGWALDGYEDWDVWMSFAERGWNGVNVGRVIGLYRLHGPRRESHDRGRHEELVATLSRRHYDLMRRRRRHWLASRAPWRAKVLFPLIGALPLLSASLKTSLYSGVRYPGAAVRLHVTRHIRAPLTLGRNDA
jgi:glycosyltransferase involved in cell wall biosynthesis